MPVYLHGGRLLNSCQERRAYWCRKATTHELQRLLPQILQPVQLECSYKSGGGGCNFCAPTCFRESYVIDLYEGDKLLESPSAFVWPGCNCGGLTDRSNFVVNFPDDATPEKRAGIIAGMMLIEYAVNEKKQQDNKNNNGGGGGAPPTSQTMSR